MYVISFEILKTLNNFKRENIFRNVDYPSSFELESTLVSDWYSYFYISAPLRGINLNGTADRKSRRNEPHMYLRAIFLRPKISSPVSGSM